MDRNQSNLRGKSIIHIVNNKNFDILRRKNWIVVLTSLFVDRKQSNLCVAVDKNSANEIISIIRQVTYNFDCIKAQLSL
mgnify:CR=1 FL=1